jgi:hypothetical protein
MADWMPGPRAEILGMCAKWMMYMTEDRRTAWGAPAAEFTALGVSGLTQGASLV